MSYRSRALQLGAARNACLSRAADAWRRGDGAAAKRFSREGHDLNAKMGIEMAEAADKLVRERAKLAEQAVKARDSGWSDEPGDRTSRGRVCGGGLGVCLGIASKHIGGDGKLTPEERTESMLDLHGLHSNEATEVLEEFLLSVGNRYLPSGTYFDPSPTVGTRAFLWFGLYCCRRRKTYWNSRCRSWCFACSVGDRSSRMGAPMGIPVE
jgi:hypothetical protein